MGCSQWVETTRTAATLLTFWLLTQMTALYQLYVFKIVVVNCGRCK